MTLQFEVVDDSHDKNRYWEMMEYPGGSKPGFYAFENYSHWKLVEIRKEYPQFEVTNVFLNYTDLVLFSTGELEYTKEYSAKVHKRINDWYLEQPCQTCKGTRQMFDRWSTSCTFSHRAYDTFWKGDPTDRRALYDVYKTVKLTKPCTHCRGFGDNSYWAYNPIPNKDKEAEKFSFKGLLRLYAYLYWHWKWNHDEFEMFSYETDWMETLARRLKRDFKMSEMAIHVQSMKIYYHLQGKPVRLKPRHAAMSAEEKAEARAKAVKDYRYRVWNTTKARQSRKWRKRFKILFPKDAELFKL